jgi:hypothetical protein
MQPTPEATDLRITILYRKSDDGDLTLSSEVASRGALPSTVESRATCGVLLIALGCFEVNLGAEGFDLQDYPDCVTVDTATRTTYATSLDLKEVRSVVLATLRLYAEGSGINDIESMTESVTASLIGEAVQVLNGDTDAPKFNAPGGVA